MRDSYTPAPPSTKCLDTKFIYRVIHERRNPTFRHAAKMKIERKNADWQQRTAGTCSSNVRKK